MPNIQVRDVPEEVHTALVKRAQRCGQSLQQYLQGELERLAATPTNEELFDRIDAQTGDLGAWSGAAGRLSGRQAVAALEAERDRRR